MPGVSSSIVGIPPMGDMLAYAATYSTPTFNAFLYPMLIGLGIALAALSIAFIVNGLIGAVKWLYYELMLHWSNRGKKSYGHHMWGDEEGLTIYD